HPTRKRHGSTPLAYEERGAEAVADVGDPKTADAAHESPGVRRGRVVVHAVVAVAGDVAAVGEEPGARAAVGQGERVELAICRTAKDAQGRGAGGHGCRLVAADGQGEVDLALDVALF